MIIGRGIYGLGYQMVCICKNIFLTHWFFKSDVSLPFSLCQCTIDITKFICFYFSPKIINICGGDISSSFWLGFALSVFSFIGCLICAYLELTIENPEKITYIQDHSATTTMNPIKALKNLKTEFWLLCIVFCSCISTVLPLINFSTEFLYKTKFAYMTDKKTAESEASFFTGCCFILCAILDPIMGMIQKKVGLRPYFLLLSTILGLLAIMLFNYYPMIGIISLGTSQSILYTVFWITMSFVVNKSDEEASYCIASILMYVGLTINPIVVAKLY